MGKLMCFLGFHKRIQAHARVGHGPLVSLTKCECCGKREWEVCDGDS